MKGAKHVVSLCKLAPPYFVVCNEFHCSDQGASVLGTPPIPINIIYAPLLILCPFLNPASTEHTSAAGTGSTEMDWSLSRWKAGGEAGGGSGEESGQCIIEKGGWERAGLELPVRAHRIERIPLNAILIVPCSQVDGTYFICLYFLNINEYIAWTPKPWIRNVVSDVRNHWMCIDCRLSR